MVQVILDGGLQSYRSRQNMFNVGIKVTNITSIDVIWSFDYSI